MKATPPPTAIPAIAPVDKVSVKKKNEKRKINSFDRIIITDL